MPASPPPRVVLHIGLHKTGSTAFQRTLAAQWQALQRHGVRVATAGNAHGLAESLAAGEAITPEIAASLIGGPGTTTVLSSEQFSLLPEAALRRLAASLAPARVEVVCVLRSPLEALPAWWAERLKHGDTHTLPEFLMQRLLAPQGQPLLDLAAVLERFAAVFGRDALRPFPYGGDVPALLFREVLGMEPPPRATRLNPTPNPAACEVMRMIGALGGDPLRVIRAEPEALALVQAVRETAPRHRRRLELSMAQPVFATAERRLVEGWGDLLERFPTTPGPFETRQRAVVHVDPTLWTAEPALAEQVRRVSQLKC